jgi:hypothetical protein
MSDCGLTPADKLFSYKSRQDNECLTSYHLFVMDVDCKLFCSPLLYFDMLSIILLTNYIAYYKRFGYVKLVNVLA